MKNNCIYFTRFAPNDTGNGGERRTAQLYKTFSFLNPQICSIIDNKRNLKSYFLFLFSIITSFFSIHIKIRKWGKIHRSYAQYLHYISYEWISQIKKDEISLVLIDDPIYFYPLVIFQSNDSPMSFPAL